jgi:hypothetical protein
MSKDTDQTLTVVAAGGHCGDLLYTWEIVEGGGSLNTNEGEEVIYSAPSSNANCDSNPVIALYCNGILVDNLAMAINAFLSDAYKAVWVVSSSVESSCIQQSETRVICQRYIYVKSYSCMGNYKNTEKMYGTSLSTEAVNNCEDCFDMLDTMGYSEADIISLAAADGYSLGQVIDIRGDWYIENGCCCEQLL